MTALLKGSPNPALHELQGNFCYARVQMLQARVCSSAGSRRSLDLLGVCKRLPRSLGPLLGEKVALSNFNAHSCTTLLMLHTRDLALKAKAAVPLLATCLTRQRLCHLCDRERLAAASAGRVVYLFDSSGARRDKFRTKPADAAKQEVCHACAA